MKSIHDWKTEKNQLNENLALGLKYIMGDEQMSIDPQLRSMVKVMVDRIRKQYPEKDVMELLRMLISTMGAIMMDMSGSSKSVNQFAGGLQSQGEDNAEV